VKETERRKREGHTQTHRERQIEKETSGERNRER
jgi:hypothetical protein